MFQKLHPGFRHPLHYLTILEFLSLAYMAQNTLSICTVYLLCSSLSPPALPLSPELWWTTSALRLKAQISSQSGRSSSVCTQPACPPQDALYHSTGLSSQMSAACRLPPAVSAADHHSSPCLPSPQLPHS